MIVGVGSLVAPGRAMFSVVPVAPVAATPGSVGKAENWPSVPVKQRIFKTCEF